jgi:hypothetical protein
MPLRSALAKRDESLPGRPSPMTSAAPVTPACISSSTGRHARQGSRRPSVGTKFAVLSPLDCSAVATFRDHRMARVCPALCAHCAAMIRSTTGPRSTVVPPARLRSSFERIHWRAHRSGCSGGRIGADAVEGASERMQWRAHRSGCTEGASERSALEGASRKQFRPKDSRGRWLSRANPPHISARGARIVRAVD